MTSDTCSVIYPRHFPDEIRALPHWVMWKYQERDGKLTKVPFSPQGGMAKANDPATWGDFSVTINTRNNDGFDGVGFELTAPYVGIDFDHVRDPVTGIIDPEALAEIKALNSYTEISPSRTGIHVIVKGIIPGKRSKKGDREMYDKARFLTMTSHMLPEFPTVISDSQLAIDTLYEKWFGKDSEPSEEPVADAELPDKQIIERCKELHGDRFTKLWSGNFFDYPSQSEADLSLCTIIAGQAPLVTQVDRIFRQSGLYREKWDEFRGEQTYGQKTMQTAVVNAKKICQFGKKKTKKQDPEEPHKTLLYFEKNKKIYFTTITPEDTFRFVHQEDGTLVFDDMVIGNDGIPIYPRGLDRHKNTGELVRIVGYPRSDKLQAADSIEAQDLYQKIEKHLIKYIDVPDSELEMIVFYLMYSWFYTKCHTALYLRLLADTGKGKSRILNAVADLCLYPITSSGASMYSGIMRLKEKYHGVLKIDESDLTGGARNPLIKYLNLGFEQGQLYILTDKNNPDVQDYFDPFGPKLIAMREPFGDNATEARCLSFTPSETTRTDIPAELNKEYHTSVEDLRASIALLTLQNWEKIDGEKLIDCSTLNLEPRMKQMLRPLSIVLQMFPDGRERFEKYMIVRQKEVKDIRSQSWEGQIFNHVAALSIGEEMLINHPEFGSHYRDGQILAVTGAMVAEAFKVKSNPVTRALTGMGFLVENTKIPIGTGTTRRWHSIKKYVVPSPQRWREIIQRYAPEDLVPQLASCPPVLRGKKWIDGPDTGIGQQSIDSFSAVSPTSEETGETVNCNRETACVDTLSLLSTVSCEHAVQQDEESISQRIGLNRIPDHKEYRQITTQKIGRCIVKGCSNPMVWEDRLGLNYLCDHHFQMIKKEATVQNEQVVIEE